MTEQENKFGFRFNPGDTVYHVGDSDKAYKFVILVACLKADTEGVAREYTCRMLTGSAGVFNTTSSAVVIFRNGS